MSPLLLLFKIWLAVVGAAWVVFGLFMLWMWIRESGAGEKG